MYQTGHKEIGHQICSIQIPSAFILPNRIYKIFFRSKVTIFSFLVLKEIEGWRVERTEALNAVGGSESCPLFSAQIHLIDELHTSG